MWGGNFHQYRGAKLGNKIAALDVTVNTNNANKLEIQMPMQLYTHLHWRVILFMPVEVFTSIGGQTRNYIAALDAGNWKCIIMESFCK
jgi:hypothetical protein